ncbi:amidase [Halomonas sp. HNIBRBA4712]|uniref:amidase n=1 Tax=Halomonas sp. HNIBRBA4712 TaxID=3373087 RepID=UPI00374734A1
MYLEEYQRFDAMGLAALVRRGEVSREELLKAAIEAIECFNPSLHAVVRTRFERARRESAAVSEKSCFTGVPTLAKDLLMALAGEPLASGSAALKGVVAKEDSPIITRARQAGLVILGQSATPEFGLMAITEPRAFAHPQNPWRLGHSPGGSSGGAAAAVAGGIVPLALAGDGGGSIRIPASYCGLFGFKPSRGRVPLAPSQGEVWQGAVVEHAITRSVRDSAALLEQINGSVAASPYPVARETGYLAALEQDPKPLRVALSLGEPLSRGLSGALDPAVKAAVEKVGLELVASGHTVAWADPPVEGETLAESYLTLYLGQMAAELDSLSRETATAFRRLAIESTTRAIGRLGGALDARRYELARREWSQAGARMGAFHERFDVLVLPVATSTAPGIGELYPSPARERLMALLALPGMSRLALKFGLLKHFAADALARTPFTQLANLTGQPAMSLPLHLSQGLPVGVQVIGRMGEDKRLFQLAAALERRLGFTALPSSQALKAPAG